MESRPAGPRPAAATATPSGQHPLATDGVRRGLAPDVVDDAPQRLHRHAPPPGAVGDDELLDGPYDGRCEGSGQDSGHAGVVLDDGGLRGVDPSHRDPYEQIIHSGLRDVYLAERRQDGGDVTQERPVGTDDEHAGAPEAFAVRVEQVGGAVQADGGLSRARRPLHADGLVEVGAHQHVLVGLDGRDDVAHRPDAGALDLGGQDPRGGAELLTAIELLVLESGERSAGEAEAAADPYAPRLRGAGLVEGP